MAAYDWNAVRWAGSGLFPQVPAANLPLGVSLAGELGSTPQVWFMQQKMWSDPQKSGFKQYASLSKMI